MIWGETSIRQSDSVQIESYSTNNDSGTHVYHSSGVMILARTHNLYVYIHNSKRVLLQLLRCYKGLFDHQTDFEVQSHVPNSHGKSDLGFNFNLFTGVRFITKV